MTTKEELLKGKYGTSVATEMVKMYFNMFRLKLAMKSKFEQN